MSGKDTFTVVTQKPIKSQTTISNEHKVVHCANICSWTCVMYQSDQLDSMHDVRRSLVVHMLMSRLQARKLLMTLWQIHSCVARKDPTLSPVSERKVLMKNRILSMLVQRTECAVVQFKRQETRCAQVRVERHKWRPLIVHANDDLSISSWALSLNQTDPKMRGTEEYACTCTSACAARSKTLCVTEQESAWEKTDLLWYFMMFTGFFATIPFEQEIVFQVNFLRLQHNPNFGAYSLLTELWLQTWHVCRARLLVQITAKLVHMYIFTQPLFWEKNHICQFKYLHATVTKMVVALCCHFGAAVECTCEPLCQWIRASGNRTRTESLQLNTCQTNFGPCLVKENLQLWRATRTSLLAARANFTCDKWHELDKLLTEALPNCQQQSNLLRCWIICTHPNWCPMQTATKCVERSACFIAAACWHADQYGTLPWQRIQNISICFAITVVFISDKFTSRFAICAEENETYLELSLARPLHCMHQTDRSTLLRFIWCKSFKSPFNGNALSERSCWNNKKEKMKSHISAPSSCSSWWLSSWRCRIFLPASRVYWQELNTNASNRTSLAVLCAARRFKPNAVVPLDFRRKGWFC